MKSLKITLEFHSNPLKSPEDPMEFPILIPSYPINLHQKSPMTSPDRTVPSSSALRAPLPSSSKYTSSSFAVRPHGGPRLGRLRSVLELDIVGPIGPSGPVGPPKKIWVCLKMGVYPQ